MDRVIVHKSEARCKGAFSNAMTRLNFYQYTLPEGEKKSW